MSLNSDSTHPGRDGETNPEEEIVFNNNSIHTSSPIHTPIDSASNNANNDVEMVEVRKNNPHVMV